MKKCCEGYTPMHRENVWMDIHQFHCPKCMEEGRWMPSIEEAKREWNKMINNRK